MVMMIDDDDDESLFFNKRKISNMYTTFWRPVPEGSQNLSG